MVHTKSRHHKTGSFTGHGSFKSNEFSMPLNKNKNKNKSQDRAASARHLKRFRLNTVAVRGIRKLHVHTKMVKDPPDKLPASYQQAASHGSCTDARRLRRRWVVLPPTTRLFSRRGETATQQSSFLPPRFHKTHPQRTRAQPTRPTKSNPTRRTAGSPARPPVRTREGVGSGAGGRKADKEFFRTKLLGIFFPSS